MLALFVGSFQHVHRAHLLLNVMRPSAVGQTACVLFAVMCVLWSQLCYPWALNSKTLFEAIIDGNDQAMLGSTYNKWLLGLFSDEVRPSCLPNSWNYTSDRWCCSIKRILLSSKLCFKRQRIYLW